MPGRVIADFTRLHRRRAGRMGCDLKTDSGFMGYLVATCEGSILEAGLDPDAMDSPFDESGEPLVADGEDFALTVNWGKWIVQCASCDGYLAVRKCEPLTICFACWHDGDIRFRRVVWPGDETYVAKMERVLLQRPRPNQNWDGSETLDELIQENLDHGAPVPAFAE